MRRKPRFDQIPPAPLKPGDVIQLGPQSLWAGCLGFVDEIRSWGVTANIVVPLQGFKAGLVPIRAATGEFKRVGPPQYLVAFLQDPPE
jgi:hypothetical protein